MRITGRTAGAIAASIEAQLQAGAAGPGDSLPPVRALALQLRVSAATVAAAYKVLKGRGWTSGSGRSGTRVATRPPVASTAVRPSLPEGVVDLASGNPDPALLPPLDSAIRALRSEVVLYDAGGVDRGLLAFASADFEADGIPSRAVAVVSGALDGIERTLREHVRPGDRVAVEDPTFPGVVELIQASGLVPVPCAVDDRGVRPDALDESLGRGCRAVVLTPRAQNPTGAAFDPLRAADLRRVLRRYPEVLLLQNDCAAPIAGVPIHPLRTGPHERWALVRSTSKFLGPDLRVALVAGDESTIARVERRQALGARWVSRILQQLVLALWSDPSSGRRLARAAAIYSQRRQGLQAALADRGIEVPATSGFNVWVPVADEARVVHALMDRGWAVAPGTPFRIRTGRAIRVTASTLEPRDAGRFAADLAQALRLSGSTPA